MFWDRAACVYDIFACIINRRANRALCEKIKELIRPDDEVLECACGTGLLTGVIAPRCRKLVATDFSEKMLGRAARKYEDCGVRFERADIMRLPYPDGSFDAVVAANVIHLLDEPYAALRELVRVCRTGGRIIIPTYMNETDNGGRDALSGAIGRAGANFRHTFTPDTYRRFFEEAGISGVRYFLCEGRIPCNTAVFEKNGDKEQET